MNLTAPPFSIESLENKFQPLLNISLLLTILGYFGLLSFLHISEEKVLLYTQIVHFVIALFLAWKFHPFKKTYAPSKHDHVIIFSISFFMILDFFFQIWSPQLRSLRNLIITT